MGRPRKYPEELIERAVRMAVESNRPVAHVAADFGMDGERLRRYAFIDLYRDRFGVEPICRTLGVSCSAYYERAHGRRSARAVEDERLLGVIRELHLANCEAYGYRRMWKALLRAGEQVPRCRVARLMRQAGIRGAKRRGKPWRTTRPDLAARWRPDLVERNFTAPAPNLAMGRRLDLSALLGRRPVFRVRDRCPQPPGGRLAARLAYAHRPGPRRAPDGPRHPRARRGAHAGPPLRQ